ncbi:FkbM family methyltransferase [Flavimarina sp. Hel_I_48]|uniref:FkbM family methyltransferase n=1 Tax=Flavimarina sp. Hel_I_48 TaxID=1392488 RepID=UPI00068AFDCF|nr:FkbM family methyltransferase [Flavimarina sp. Hel_I_48]
MKPKNYVKRAFLQQGLIGKSVTETDRVVSLINRLRPKAIEKGMVRLGPQRDGGYVLPDDLEYIEACFSPGVEQMSQFEEDCLKHDIKIFLADASVEKPTFKEGETRFNFLKKHIGTYNSEHLITMDSWVDGAGLKEDSDLLLQMDIEYAEYPALLTISDKLMRRFRILVIEFHGLEKFWDPDFFRISESVFDKLLYTHSCVHIHPNNYKRVVSRNGVDIPKAAEFTFLRNDRDDFKDYQREFPHALDFDNCITEKPVKLPENWYK